VKASSPCPRLLATAFLAAGTRCQRSFHVPDHAGDYAIPNRDAENTAVAPMIMDGGAEAE